MRLLLALVLLWDLSPAAAAASASASPAPGPRPASAPAAPVPVVGALGGLAASLSSPEPSAGALDAAYDLNPARPAAQVPLVAGAFSAPAAPLAPAAGLAAAAPGPASASGPAAPEPPSPSGPADPAGPAGPGGPSGPSGPGGRGPRRVVSQLPNLVTGLNLASGLAAIVLASHGLAVPAAAAIVLAILFDMADGRLARALGVSGPIGAELDSLADVVSFGVAPAVLVLTNGLASWGPAGFAVTAAYAFAGAYRLARFNVMAQDPAAPHTDSFTGLPIPGGAGVVVATVLGLAALPAGVPHGPVAAGMTLLAAAAMVSRLPYPAFKKGGLKALAGPAAVGAGAAAAAGLLAGPALIPAALFGLYLMTGPAIKLYRDGSEVFKKELKRKAFHQAALLYLAAYHLFGHPTVVWAMAAWMLVVTGLELLRLKSPWARTQLMKVFGGLIREKEANRLSGAFYVSLGMFAVMAFFGSNPALVAAAALMLALGDSVSVLVGLRFGWIPFKIKGVQRSVGGALAGFATAFLIGVFLGFGPLAALGAALAFSVVDIYPVKPDDNLWIPVVGAAALAFLSRF